MPDTQIVFLLSMPRAGSTLLQRLLMGSGVVKTVGEPSFLLRLLGLGGDPLLRASTYSEALVETAMDDMRKAWGGFDACWKKGVHDMAVSIYNGLAGGFPYFLDKTPRYSLIAEELVEVFPEAKFIVLWRHPLAVMNSMSTTFREGYWEPNSFDLDLYHGIDQLRKICAKHGDRVHQVKYEDLAANPQEELARLGAYLGMPNLAEVADKELAKGNEGKLGDPTGVKKYSKVSAASISEWEGGIRNWYREGWVKKYFRGERAEFFRSMGYDLPQSMKEGKVPLGLLDGIRDWLYANRVLNRRILRPLGAKRRINKQAKRRGYHVTFR
ncbi:sulfotransferase [Haloferula sp. BvORR071]|uniref:sulfotransferase family protein n=1 Tax=Haloferula sp. BvORR071 TaxID=1396141 RepID=UPI0005529196|nr:sulfotransferase [Haloferula sp. BvORR071]